MFLRMRPDGNLGDLWYMDVTVPVVAALLALQTLCHRFKGVAIRLLFRLVHTSLAQGTQSELTPTHPPTHPLYWPKDQARQECQGKTKNTLRRTLKNSDGLGLAKQMTTNENMGRHEELKKKFAQQKFNCSYVHTALQRKLSGAMSRRTIFNQIKRSGFPFSLGSQFAI